VVINRQNNDVLSKANDRSSLLLQTVDYHTTNKIKMNENQSDGLS